MNQFEVLSAVYDGSAPLPSNPLVNINMNFNGNSKVWIQVYWKAIQQANTVAGITGVQQLLAALTLQSWTGAFTSAPVPDFSSDDIPEPALGTQQTCNEAMAAGSWSA